MNNQLEQFCLMLLFGALYYLVYRRNGQFKSNRFYLLSAMVLSIVIPLLSFQVFPYEVFVAEIRSGPAVPANIDFESTFPKKSIPYWTIIYLIGAGISLIHFCIQIGRIALKIRSADFEAHNNCQFSFSKSHSASSFFHFIFLEDENEVLINHELAHANLMHSIDRILMALFQVVFWFNPLTYLYRHWMIENHEFEADRYTLKNLNIKKSDYGQFLIGHKTASVARVALSNQFHSLIKNRIHMLSKKSKNNPITYLLAIVVSLFAGSAFTLDDYPVYVQAGGEVIQDSIPNKKTDRYYEAKENRIVLVEYRNDPIVFNNLRERIDTIIIFNPENYTETVNVERVIFPLVPSGNESITAAKRRELATFSETFFIKTNASSLEIRVKVLHTDGLFIARIVDSQNREIEAVPVSGSSEFYEFSSDLDLQPGEYAITRSDGGQEVKLVVK